MADEIKRSINSQPPQTLAKKITKTLLTFLLVFGIALLIQGFKGQINVKNQTADFLETTGYCMDYEESKFEGLGIDRRIRGLYDFFAYEVNGVRYTAASARIYGEESLPGGEVAIKYNPHNPDEAFVYSESYYRDLIIAGLILSLGTSAAIILPLLIKKKLSFITVNLSELAGAVIFLIIGGALVYFAFDDIFYFLRGSMYRLMFVVQLVASCVFISGCHFLSNSFFINDLTSIKAEDHENKTYSI